MPLIGLTGGSKAQSWFPEVNATGISAGLNIRFQPPVLPDDLQLTSNGLLSCKPLEPGKTWIIPVCVEDYQGLQANRELVLPTASLGAEVADADNPGIKIYPNPVTDRSFVQIESNRSGDIELMVIDLTGKVQFIGSYSIKAGKTIFQLDLSKDFTPGIYVVQATGIITYRSKIYFTKPAG